MEWSYNLLNVQPAWQEGVTGAGVRVRVNDPDGVDLQNPEFAGRVDLDASCDEFAPQTFQPGEPFQLASANHGTGVASVAVGGANNGVCAAGIAPGATLSACIVPEFPVDYPGMFLAEIGVTDISVNSWGEGKLWMNHNSKSLPWALRLLTLFNPLRCLQLHTNKKAL
jgi:Subtilase family